MPTRGNYSFWTKFQDIEHGLSIEDSFCLFICNCVLCSRQGIIFDIFTASNRTRTTSDVIDDTCLHRRRERTDISAKFLTQSYKAAITIGRRNRFRRKWNTKAIKNTTSVPLRSFRQRCNTFWETPRTRRKDSKSDFITSRDKAFFEDPKVQETETCRAIFIKKKKILRAETSDIYCNILEVKILSKSD